MNIEQLESYAPYLVILLMFIWQNNIFVRPEQLEKKHREILADVKKDFVELNAYREFQSHVLKEIGLDKKRSDSALRLSFSKDNTKEEIDLILCALEEATKKLRRS